MPRVCRVCSHPKRQEIDLALVAGELSFRNIAERFTLSLGSLTRHKADHLPGKLARAKDAKEQREATDIMAELQGCFIRVNKLFDACDAWLSDPNDPERYDLGPRAEELDVTFTETVIDRNGNPRTIRKKQPLSRLLAEVKGESTRDFILIETKHADPRDLLLKSAARLNGHIELLAKLIGELDDRPIVNIITNPAWIELRSTLLGALQSFPEARLAVSSALTSIEVQHVA